MDLNKLDRLFKLEFYKKQRLWANKTDSRTPICELDDTQNRIAENLPSMENRDESVDQGDGNLIPNTITHTELLPGPNFATTNTGTCDPCDVEHRNISSRLKLFITLSRQETELNSNLMEIGGDHSQVTMNSDPSSVEVEEDSNANESGGIVSDLNMAMLRLHSQEYSDSEKSISNVSYTSGVLAFAAEAGSPQYEHENLGEETHNNWVRMFEAACVENGYETSFRPVPLDDSNDSFVSFMRGIHAVPHSSTNDLNYMGCNIINPEHLTRYSLAEMSPRQLEVGICHVYQVWKLLMKEARERNIQLFNRLEDSFVPSFEEEPSSIRSLRHSRSRFRRSSF